MEMHKDMTNLEIAELLRAVAASYQLKDGEKSSKGRSAPGRNKFRIIAYQRVADAVEHASSELKDLWDDGKLNDVPSIGTSIASHLDELFRTGKSVHFAEVMKGFPQNMFELMKIPGIGVKTAFKLVNELKLHSTRRILLELEKAARAGKIAKIEGFGETSQADILKSLLETRGKTRRHLLPYATRIAEELVDWLSSLKEVKRADPLGSLRREASTVGDIDIAVASDNPKQVIEHFVVYPKTSRILEKGDRTASIILPGDVQVDLMVQSPEAYGALLQHFTGSKHHNIALREYAKSLSPGLSLSEYGIRVKGKIKKFTSEEEFYNFLGMDWIPPELRENSGEIEAALNYTIPKLLEFSEIKADLQIHSSFDIETSHDLGESSMEEIVKKANELGYEYISFTEHNPSRSKHSEKAVIDILKRKKSAIDMLNYSYLKNENIRVAKVFNSLEIDIRPNGELSISEKALDLLDFALISIHSSFRQEKGRATERILRAFENPKIKILAHPTTRILNEREGIELDWPKIFDYCVKNDKWLEINADPSRLDLSDVLVREAVKNGVKLSLCTDAHHKDSMDNMRFGVSVARRGWASNNDIVNTRSLEEFEKML